VTGEIPEEKKAEIIAQILFKELEKKAKEKAR